MKSRPAARATHPLILFLLFVLLAPAPGFAQEAPPQPAAILPLNQVRIGQKGYGLTVFHGDKIEPFAVEVISVMTDFAPRRGVVWIRCPDPRMQLSGPVQGMSGSPIYLWDDNEPQELGKGGKLIGAFAFGYQASKDCYVGVQPIEYMRDTGERALEPAKPKGQAANQPTDTIRRLLGAAATLDLPRRATWRAEAMQRLLEGASGGASKPTPTPAPPPGLEGMSGQPRALMLPMALRSADLARILGPVLEPMGIAPMQMPAGATGKPPPDTDAQKIAIAPGSVLAIPLAWGDMDLSAVGTVTDVLPDGRVLGFGHAMFGQGDIAVPMASGYVHLVMPGLVNSFKLGGSAVIRGGIVRDEMAAVVGTPKGEFETAPVRMLVNMAGQKPMKYSYEVVHHKVLTPPLAATVAIESVTALQSSPLENTVRLHGTMRFAGDRELKIDTVVPTAGPQELAMQLIPPLALLASNPHESMMLTSADLQADVEPVMKVASLVSARLDTGEIAPGRVLGLSVKIQAYEKPPFEKRLQVTIPESLPDGDYDLHICDAPTYLNMYMQSRPHLMQTTNADELFKMVQRVLSVPSDSIFLVMQVQQDGIAVGRQEMPRLPSSRRAMLASPVSSTATPYAELVEKAVPLGLVTDGDLSFTISVREELSKD